jgi:hypothetical protein
MRDTSDPRDQNYDGPSQDDSYTALEDDRDGLGPPRS